MGSQDLGNIVLLEHVNLAISDQAIASIFYFEGLGFTRDPYRHVGARLMWVNIGYQQFHLPTKSYEEVVCGRIGLIVPSLEHVLDGLSNVKERLSGTKFGYEVVQDASNPYIPHASRQLSVTSPSGNQFTVFENNPQIDFRGDLGMPYVEFFCRRDRAVKIATFYKHYFGAHYAVEVHGGSTFAKIYVGPNQVLIFRESDENQVIAYSGYHIAIYVADFSTTFEKFKRDHLLYSYENNVCETLDEALRIRQFRTLRIVDPNQEGQKDDLFLLEHEVRSMFHKSYMRPLVNRNGTVGIYCNQ